MKFNACDFPISSLLMNPILIWFRRYLRKISFQRMFIYPQRGFFSYYILSMCATIRKIIFFLSRIRSRKFYGKRNWKWNYCDGRRCEQDVWASSCVEEVTLAERNYINNIFRKRFPVAWKYEIEGKILKHDSHQIHHKQIKIFGLVASTGFSVLIILFPSGENCLKEISLWQ